MAIIATVCASYEPIQEDVESDESVMDGCWASDSPEKRPIWKPKHRMRPIGTALFIRVRIVSAKALQWRSKKLLNQMNQLWFVEGHLIRETTAQSDIPSTPEHCCTAKRHGPVTRVITPNVERSSGPIQEVVESNESVVIR